MSVVVNNDFSNDTYGIRAERLNAIQGNFSSIQTELEAPANIETWAATCYDDYSTIWSASGVEANESESAELKSFKVE